MENSIDGAFHKIAELLDGTLSSEMAVGSSQFMNHDLEEFDIGEFV